MRNATDFLNSIVDAWEALPGGRQVRNRDVEQWLADDMSPAINATRGFLHRPKPDGTMVPTPERIPPSEGLRGTESFSATASYVDEFGVPGGAKPEAVASTSGVIGAALEEYLLTHVAEDDDQRLGRHSAIRGMMVRLGLYAEFCAALASAASEGSTE